jgi:hypothetical protein
MVGTFLVLYEIELYKIESVGKLYKTGTPIEPAANCLVRPIDLRTP